MFTSPSTRNVLDQTDKRQPLVLSRFGALTQGEQQKKKVNIENSAAGQMSLLPFGHHERIMLTCGRKSVFAIRDLQE